MLVLSRWYKPVEDTDQGRDQNLKKGERKTTYLLAMVNKEVEDLPFTRVHQVI